MLVAVALVAVLLAWFAAARNRADLQDQLVTTLEERGGHIYAQRWGPHWLDLVGGSGSAGASSARKIRLQ